MTDHNHAPQGQAGQCVWCESEYLPAYSHARTTALFCSTKCEVEARFWLVSSLEAPLSS